MARLGRLLSPVPRFQTQSPTWKPPLVCDPNPRNSVRNREWTEEQKQPITASHANDDHHKAGANTDRGDEGGHESFRKGEIREMALQRPGLRLEAPGRSGPLRMEQSIRQSYAAGWSWFDDDETDVFFFSPGLVSAFCSHRMLKTIS